MKIKGNTVLITGGATGIGLALAEVFLTAGNQVLICGRRENKLKEAQNRLTGLQARPCDVASAADRAALFQWVMNKYPALNILINNAGIQQMLDFTGSGLKPSSGQDEIETNLAAPVSLCAYFTPLLRQQKTAAIINVSSGLGFVPMAAMPVYCATKAALHSFTVSLRHQLRNTPVKVFELIPPAVATELGQEPGGTEPQYPGIAPAEVAKETIAALARDEYEIAVGEVSGLREGACRNFTETFARLNSR
jgi:uncharacterized oxidoreductase